MLGTGFTATHCHCPPVQMTAVTLCGHVSPPLLGDGPVYPPPGSPNSLPVRKVSLQHKGNCEDYFKGGRMPGTLGARLASSPRRTGAGTTQTPDLNAWTLFSPGRRRGPIHGTPGARAVSESAPGTRTTWQGHPPSRAIARHHVTAGSPEQEGPRSRRERVLTASLCQALCQELLKYHLI